MHSFFLHLVWEVCFGDDITVASMTSSAFSRHRLGGRVKMKLCLTLRTRSRISSDVFGATPVSLWKVASSCKSWKKADNPSSAYEGIFVLGYFEPRHLRRSNVYLLCRLVACWPWLCGDG